jgi:hypothetical protein
VPLPSRCLCLRRAAERDPRLAPQRKLEDGLRLALSGESGVELSRCSFWLLFILELLALLPDGSKLAAAGMFRWYRRAVPALAHGRPGY